MTELEEELLRALSRCSALIDQMSPFIGRMALPDYSLFNAAPIEARTVIAKAERQKLPDKK
jgi:hypothetical protein